MRNTIPVQTFLTKLMLLEKENQSLKTELDKTRGCNGNNNITTGTNAAPNDKYTYLLSSQIDSAIVIDIASHPAKIIDCNNRTPNLFNISRKEIIGHDILDFIPTDQKRYFLENLHDTTNYKKHHFVIHRFDKYRENQVLDITGYALSREDKDVVVLRLRDITYKSELLDGLEGKPPDEESTFKNYPIFTFFFQYDGTDFILAKAENEIGEIIYREKIRKSASTLFPRRHDIITDMKQCLREGLRFSRECHFQGFFTERLIYASFTYSYLQPDYVVMNVYDLTLQKAMEQELKIAKEKAEQSEQLKTAFLSNISSELRTPLNSIAGFSQLIASSPDKSAQQIQYCDQIQNNTKQLIHMIGDIMELARIESGDLKVIYSGINLNEVLEEYAQMYRNILTNEKQSHVKLIISKGCSDGDDLFDTDPDRLKQVLMNLLENAIRFTLKGTITFGYEKRANEFLFFVEDTGVGIPPEEQEAIFTRFHKADNQLLDENPGIGLGLPIARQLVEMMGGEGISVSSTPNKGSRFSFALPC